MSLLAGPETDSAATAAGPPAAVPGNSAVTNGAVTNGALDDSAGDKHGRRDRDEAGLQLLDGDRVAALAHCG